MAEGSSENKNKKSVGVGDGNCRSRMYKWVERIENNNVVECRVLVDGVKFCGKRWTRDKKNHKGAPIFNNSHILNHLALVHKLTWKNEEWENPREFKSGVVTGAIHNKSFQSASAFNMRCPFCGQQTITLLCHHDRRHFSSCNSYIDFYNELGYILTFFSTSKQSFSDRYFKIDIRDILQSGRCHVAFPT